MNIIVTGCFGFIGFNFLNHLRSKYNNEFYVVGIDSLNNPYSISNYNSTKEDKNFNFYKSDISDISELNIKNKDKIDLIVNFAAESHVDTSIYNPEIFVHSNILGVNKLLTYCVENKINNFVQISTDEVYGSSKNSYFSETDILNPSSPYSASKAGADMVCNAFKKTFDLNIKTIRPANNYGVYQQSEKLIPFSISNIMENNEIEIYGDGNNIRHWLSVKDTVEGILTVIEKGKENNIYNIGSQEYFSNNEIAEKLLSYFKLELDSIKYIKDRPGHDYRYAINLEKINSIGWKSKYSLDNEIYQIIDWYVNNTNWWKNNIEKIRENRKLRFSI